VREILKHFYYIIFGQKKMSSWKSFFVEKVKKICLHERFNRVLAIVNATRFLSLYFLCSIFCSDSSRVLASESSFCLYVIACFHPFFLFSVCDSIALCSSFFRSDLEEKKHNLSGQQYHFLYFLFTFCPYFALGQ
jgi:hypothetical protein